MDADSADVTTFEWQVDRLPVHDSAHIQHTVSGGLVLLNVSLEFLSGFYFRLI
jgi:hypothetical protein